MENGNYGKVTQVIGSTLDAHFSEDRLPGIYNALRVEVPRTVLGQTTLDTLWCEVAQHLGGGRVRAIALGSTDGLQRGVDILDTGSPVTVPVGTETLGRVFNMVGEVIDGLGPVTTQERRPIHHAPPEFDELSSKTELFETGIKVIDLLCPLVRAAEEAGLARS
jgi:F-type H+-transporting ATPase subunit beta